MMQGEMKREKAQFSYIQKKERSLVTFKRKKEVSLHSKEDRKFSYIQKKQLKRDKVKNNNEVRIGRQKLKMKKKENARPNVGTDNYKKPFEIKRGRKYQVFSLHLCVVVVVWVCMRERE